MAVKTLVHLIVKGRVQGIGYRWFVQQSARRAGITGWVRNLPDGNVEAEAAGEKNDLEDFIRTLRAGHPDALVKEILIDWQPHGGKEFEDFEITY